MESIIPKSICPNTIMMVIDLDHLNSQFYLIGFFPSADNDEIDPDEFDSEEEYMFHLSQHNATLIDTGRIEEIPAKEPSFTAVPLKSALKKKGNLGMNSAPSSNSGTTPQDSHNTSRPLALRQDNHGMLK